MIRVKNNRLSTARIEALEGLRGIAILLVLFHHAVIVFTGLEPKNPFEVTVMTWAGHSSAGVDLFFILSGFLITRLLLKAKDSENYYKNFYVRRTLRIFPLYYAYLFFVFFTVPLFPDFFYPVVPAPSSSGWYWAYLSNFKMFFDKIIPSYYLSHTWSLAIEEQFYLFWPVIIALFPAKALKKVLAAIIVLSVAGRLYLEGTGSVNAWQLRVFTFGRLDILALGGFLAVLYEEKFFNLMKGFKIKIGAVMTCFLLMGGLSYLSHLCPALKQSLFYTQAAVLFTGLMLFMLSSSENSITRRILSFKLLTAFGKYSYSIYLFHMTAGILLRRLAVSGIKEHLVSAPLIWSAVFLLLSGISFAIGWLTYHLFEIHFLKLKDKLAAARVAPC